MAMYGQISLSWMMCIPVDTSSRPIGELIEECEQIERYAYVYHEPWGMRPHFHLYISLRDPLSLKYIKEHFSPLLAHPGDSGAASVKFLLKDVESPKDVMTNFSIEKYLKDGGVV